MTGNERVAAALAGAPTDRIPVFCNLIDQGARELGLPLREYFADGARVAEAQLRMLERYGHDNVWSLFYVGKEAELLGCREIVFADAGPPNVAHFVIETPADIARLRVPDDIAGHPAFAAPAECRRILRREVGGRTPICAYISSTMTLPAMLMGMERWLELLLVGPAADRDRLLETCHRFFVLEVDAYRRAGADIIVYSNPFGSTDMWSLRHVEERALPWIRRDIDAIGTAGVTYYCGMSRMNRVIDMVYRATGIAVYYLSPLDDLAEGKEIVGHRGLTCGVVNDSLMIDWTPAQIRERVRQMIEVGMPGSRFLLGTGVMPYDIPEANIRAFVDAADEFGRRPAAEVRP